MRRIALALAAVAALSIGSPALATTVINFDDLGNGVTVTTQYPGVTFSTVSGEQVVTSAQSLGSSLPNFICTAPSSGGLDCVNDVYVDFSTAVSGLTFLAVGDNNVGDVGDVRVFAGATLLGTIDIMGDGNPLFPSLVDLSAFAGVTRIEIAGITDEAGLGYDDFTFTAGDANGVPEPATWAMMLLGFGAMGLSMRRRRKLALA